MAITIDGIGLPYAYFEWPKYRGPNAREVVLDCPVGMYDRLAALAGKSNVKLEVTGPAGPGATAGSTTVTIERVHVKRVAKYSDAICRLYLEDNRALLSRRVADKDFNIRFGDGYLNKTQQPTVQAAMRDLVASVDVLRGNVSGAAYRSMPARPLRDGVLLSGMMLPDAVAVLAAEASCDLTVGNDGLYRFPVRGDVDGSALPAIGAYSWKVEPDWTPGSVTHGGVPRVITPYYHERHCLRMVGADPRATISDSRPIELRVQLEQVYASDGAYYTLGELLEAYGFAESDLTDAQIAGAIATENLQGTALADSFGSADFDAVHKALRDGWRVLWRIVFPAAEGGLGGWVDWSFGKLQADGAVDPAAVECPWVEFLNVPVIEPSGTYVGAAMTINHASPAPFVPTWDTDASNGVIRLMQKPLQDGNLAAPGALTSPLVIESRLNGAVSDGASNYNLSEFFVIESQDRSRAKYRPSFEVAVYMVATKRMPNDETRWHAEPVDSGLQGGSGFVELPPHESVYCLRDYVGGPDLKPADADGMGLILNRTELNDHAASRADMWKALFMGSREGMGIAESVHAFRDIEVDGAIHEVTLVVNAQEVRTRITVGNLADNTVREAAAAKRLAARRWQEGGKVSL